MKILAVTLTVLNVNAAVAFYRDRLEMPVDQTNRQAVVQVGSSQLTLIEGDQFDGAHHVAFGIPPSDFEVARDWLASRVETIVVDGSDVIDGPEGWESESLYFVGPEDIILELIARQANSKEIGGGGQRPRLLSISEIGIATPEVASTVKKLTGNLGLSTFPPQGAQFAPVGDHDGLLIVVDQERIWFPTQSLRPARGPSKIRLEAPREASHLSLTESITITSSSIR